MTQCGPAFGGPALALSPRAIGDDARILEIYNARERDSAPLTLSRYRAEHAGDRTEGGGDTLVALDAGGVVGYGSFQPAWWTGDPSVYSVEVRVDPDHARRGIGTRLYERLQSRLTPLGATRLTGWVRADAAEGRRFAARCRFRETGQVIQEYRLHIPDADPDAYAGVEERLRDAGVRIASLAELGSGEGFLRALQRLWADSGKDPPDPEGLEQSFPSWRREVVEGIGLSPETHWVALEGEQPVGMTFLKRLSEDAAENDYTGVAATHRGRGIAPALKLRAVAWARENGVCWFHTSSEVGNTPMVRINSRLGYRPGVRRLEVARDLR